MRFISEQANIYQQVGLYFFLKTIATGINIFNKDILIALSTTLYHFYIIAKEQKILVMIS